jgi:phosphoribosylamine-glycine ligase
MDGKIISRWSQPAIIARSGWRSGPNTGDGRVQPANIGTDCSRSSDEIMQPLLRGFAQGHIRGLLYPGLMITADGPRAGV